MRLKRKTAIITGGGKGIGKATALMFCTEGAIIAITGRTKKKLSDTVKEAKGKVKIIALQFDVANKKQGRDAVNKFIR